MATNFKLTKTNKDRTPTGVYEIEREWKAEKRKVEGLEKELKKHEKTDMKHAHPPTSHEANQSASPLPNMRKY